MGGEQHEAEWESFGLIGDPDTVVYENAPAAVVVNLETGRATGQGTDTITGWNTSTGPPTATR